MRGQYGRVVASALVLVVGMASLAQAAGPDDGLYLMSRYAYGGSLEFDAYYFKGGQVARSPAGNVGTFDFAAGRRATPAFIGQVTMKGGTMTVRWADGKSSESQFEVTKGDPCFGWDGGIFCPVTGFAPGERLDGRFEGGLKSTGPNGTASNLRQITFTSAGRYEMDAMGSVATPDGGPASTSQGQESGTYTINGTDLTLAPAGRAPYHLLAFPYNIDEKAKLKPDHIYFGGSMLQRLK